MDIAREASQEKTWKVNYISNENQQTIFKESCALIYKILIALVQKYDEDDSEFPIQACNEALWRAIDSKCFFFYSFLLINL